MKINLVKYESVFMFKHDSDKNTILNLLSSVAQEIKSHSGYMIKCEYWGLRVLAYKINKDKDAHYYYVAFSAPTSLIQYLKKIIDFDPKVIRYLIMRADRLDPNSDSAMLKDLPEDAEKNEVVLDRNFAITISDIS